MQIDITGHHLTITDGLRDHVNNKFQKLERHFDNLVDGHVILTVEKLVHRAEATLSVSGAKLFANASHQDMYAAIDALVGKLDRQIVKHKEKRTDHRRHEGSVGEAMQPD